MRSSVRLVRLLRLGGSPKSGRNSPNAAATSRYCSCLHRRTSRVTPRVFGPADAALAGVSQVPLQLQILQLPADAVVALLLTMCPSTPCWQEREQWRPAHLSLVREVATTMRHSSSEVNPWCGSGMQLTRSVRSCVSLSRPCIVTSRSPAFRMPRCPTSGWLGDRWTSSTWSAIQQHNSVSRHGQPVQALQCWQYRCRSVVESSTACAASHRAR